MTNSWYTTGPYGSVVSYQLYHELIMSKTDHGATSENRTRDLLITNEVLYR